MIIHLKELVEKRTALIQQISLRETCLACDHVQLSSSEEGKQIGSRRYP